jgi:hypothetical protein
MNLGTRRVQAGWKIGGKRRAASVISASFQSDYEQEQDCDYEKHGGNVQ